MKLTAAVVPAAISLGSNPAAALQPPPNPEYEKMMEGQRLIALTEARLIYQEEVERIVGDDSAPVVVDEGCIFEP